MVEMGSVKPILALKEKPQERHRVRAAGNGDEQRPRLGSEGGHPCGNPVGKRGHKLIMPLAAAILKAMTVTLIVLDSVGVGALPDASMFGDAGAHTLDHTLRATGVELPNLARLGLGSIEGVSSLSPAGSPLASYGRMNERSPGKDTTTGHWEFMGVVLEHPFKTYEHFPGEVMAAFERAIGRGSLGNYPASGTEIVKELGEAHLKTGKPIVYTSADSVFQIAAHTGVVPLEELYRYCREARAILRGEHAVARVIARPFAGEPGGFYRLGEARKDYSLKPPHPTLLDKLKEAGREVIGVGKIPDIYGHQGFTEEVPAGSNLEGIDKTLALMRRRPPGLVFTNLVEFDSLYGHRRDARGYARALLDFDARLPELLDAVTGDDVLFLVSDHGNDPTWHGSDHTREYGLLLVYLCRTTCARSAPQESGKRSEYWYGLEAAQLGTRESFADVGATIAELLDVRWEGAGESFARLLK
jgi:phosphopentomutase